MGPGISCSAIPRLHWLLRCFVIWIDRLGIDLPTVFNRDPRAIGVISVNRNRCGIHPSAAILYTRSVVVAAFFGFFVVRSVVPHTVQARRIHVTQRIIQRVTVAVQALRIRKVVAARVRIGRQPPPLRARVLPELRVIGARFRVRVEHGEVIRVPIGARGRLRVAVGQRSERALHAAIVPRPQPLRALPVLVLKVRRPARRVPGHRLRPPIVFPLQLRARRPVPLRDPLPAGVKDELRRPRARHAAHAMVQRVVNVLRRPAPDSKAALEETASLV